MERQRESHIQRLGIHSESEHIRVPESAATEAGGEEWTNVRSHLIVYICRATTSMLHTQYLIPTCCTMILIINYCAEMLRSQFLAIFRELVAFLMCAIDARLEA